MRFFQCYDGVLIPKVRVNDGQEDCLGPSGEDEDKTNKLGVCKGDELQCFNLACSQHMHRCIYQRDNWGYFVGCRDQTHLRKCGMSYLHIFACKKRSLNQLLIITVIK